MDSKAAQHQLLAEPPQPLDSNRPKHHEPRAVQPFVNDRHGPALGGIGNFIEAEEYVDPEDLDDDGQRFEDVVYTQMASEIAAQARARARESEARWGR